MQKDGHNVATHTEPTSPRVLTEDRPHDDVAMQTEPVIPNWPITQDKTHLSAPSPSI